MKASDSLTLPARENLGAGICNHHRRVGAFYEKSASRSVSRDQMDIYIYRYRPRIIQPVEIRTSSLSIFLGLDHVSLRSALRILGTEN